MTPFARSARPRGISRIGRRGSASITTALAAAVAIAATLVLGVAVAPAAAADPCATASNKILCENAKPGTAPSVWDIEGVGDPSIQGFATDISVNVGGTIGFKISTPASAYTIDIYRTGWYQGLGARKVTSVTPSAKLPQSQPQCLSDRTTELYDCGNWGLSASWTVPSDAVSGVYLALLRRADTGGRSQILFVVRDDSSRSAILFQTSDPTWQAYNTYGGSDFYQGAANGRAYKISYNRPLNTRGDLSGRDSYFSAEYAGVRFLERNGYDMSYFAGVDTDRYGSLLKNHKVFLSVGHDEYWSGGQRANVEAARDAGVNLQFLSGNEVYWKTRYESSPADASGGNYRTLVSYKETWSNAKIDPSPAWTGTWRDPRFAGPANGGSSPENALTGTMYMANNVDLPITVTQAQGKTRLWRNTSLTSMTTASTPLARSTIGYESDEDVDNGFRPSGLIRLSTTVGPTSQLLQDYGSVVAPGTTTHSLTLYRAASGALVFGAGTIQWTWGLDATHDGDGAPADVRMQQAQVNLLSDMGAQPGSLMTGLVMPSPSTDTTPPVARITSPASGASVPNGTAVTLSGTASDVGGVVAGIEVSVDGGATWRLATGTTTWTYSYIQRGVGAQSVQVRAVDDSANYAATPTTATYTVTGPYSAFGAEVPATVDSGDASPVELGLRFTAASTGFITGVRFYKSAANTGVHTGSLWSASGTRLATVAFSGESASGWQTASFSSAVAISAGTSYVVSYTAPNGRYSASAGYWDYRGLTGTPFTAAGGFGAPSPGVYASPGQFPTSTYGNTNYFVDAVFSSIDTSPLTVVSAWPQAGSSSVPLTTTVSAGFSKPAATSAILVKDGNGVTVAGSTAYDSTTNTATFTPSAPLNGFVTYSVAVTAKDASGVALSSGGSWSFTTVKPTPPENSCPCSLFSDSATPTTLQVADSAVTLGVTFSPTKDGTITGVSFYKAAGNTGAHVGTLWSASGTKLATGTFASESSSGWQTLTLASPVAVTAGTSYVASYRTTVGNYSATAGGFGADYVRGPLRVSAGGGTYSYPDAFPTASTSTNYLVDVVFMPAADPLSVTSFSPADGSLAVPTGSPISATFSQPLAAGWSMSATASGSAVAGSAVLSADKLTLTFTPSSALPAGATVRATITGIRAVAGPTLPTQSWSFVTAGSTGGTTTYSSLFGSETPATAATVDASAVEVGTAFSPSQNGTVTAIRFFKGAGNTGTHVGRLWSSTGTLLATVTFANETATGWQTATLSTPVALSAGSNYVVSYLAPKGYYASTPNYFAKAKISGPLTAPASGNGRYLYGSAGGFPTYSYGATNYFVDVVYATTVASGGGGGGGGGGGTPTGPPVSLFPSTAVPANTSWNDPGPVQVGVRFTSSQAGFITGIRFYTDPTNTGPHQVYLWTAAGAQLATATSANETGSGWQTVMFASPVAIQAGVEYRATYYAPNGRYAVDLNGLTSAVSNGPLTTVPSGGTYVYGTDAPNGVSNHNFWADVIFQTSS